jgi:hypothetical protein
MILRDDRYALIEGDWFSLGDALSRSAVLRLLSPEEEAQPAA